MRRRPTMMLAAPAMLAVAAFSMTGCSSDATATAETPAVKHLEASIARFAETHSEVIMAAGAGQPGACAVRLLGRSTSVNHGQKAYLELYCSSVSPTTRCPSNADSSAGLSAAVATLAADRRVTGIAVDNLNDEAYNQWIDKRFPTDLRDLETHGPQFGDLLNRRVLSTRHC